MRGFENLYMRRNGALRRRFPTGPPGQLDAVRAIRSLARAETDENSVTQRPVEAYRV